MNRFAGAVGHRHGDAGRIGILLANLGTPAAPTAPALRRYLAEFLSDPRVVERPRLPWLLLLHGVILNLRPRKSARAYQKIWSDDGSPLLVIARRQRDAIEQNLRARFGDAVSVTLGMNYGAPSISHALAELRAAGVRRLLVLPLYPQYAGATTGSVFDHAAAAISRWRWVPELRFVNAYHDEPAYIAALAAAIRRHRAQHGAAQTLLFSFHGLPQSALSAGDPYHCQCQKTARLVAENLQLADREWLTVFQSRFGREPWLQPYADETLQKLPAAGVTSVDIACPGFSADCLETLEEIAMQNRELFLHAGGRKYRYIPCLNDDAEHIAMLCDLIARNFGDWPARTEAENAAAVEGKKYALALGAPR